jgi:hypothetical protein
MPFRSKRDEADVKFREEFMFGSEPIIAWRLWDIFRPAEQIGNFGHFIEALADAHDENPANPYRYLLQPRLKAIGYGKIPWPPGKPMVAECDLNECAGPPGRTHQCGIWAVTKEEDLFQQMAHYGSPAFGKVKLWGRFMEFEKGIRAQYAYPLEITLLRQSKKLAAELAEVYGVPVEAIDELPERLMRSLPKATLEALAWHGSHRLIPVGASQMLVSHGTAMVLPASPPMFRGTP